MFVLKEYFKFIKREGLWGTINYFMKFSEIRPDGKLIGIDKFGNKYFQAIDYKWLPNSRNRWVEYSAWDFDASQIPPEWHGWIHHSTDLTGDQVLKNFQHKWSGKHFQNLTATPSKYTPTNYLYSSDIRAKAKESGKKL